MAGAAHDGRAKSPRERDAASSLPAARLPRGSCPHLGREHSEAPSEGVPRPGAGSSPEQGAARALDPDEHARMLRIAAVLVAVGLVVASPAPVWTWPTASRAVVRGFEAPATPYAAGHRGLDVPAAVGDPVRAVDDGVVAFAGTVVDRGVVAVDHDGVRSSVEPVEPAVREGAAVRRGEVIGHVG